jgi:hypothetical protein
MAEGLLRHLAGDRFEVFIADEQARLHVFRKLRGQMQARFAVELQTGCLRPS